MRIFLSIVAVLFILGGGACAVPSLVTYRALDGEGYISGSGAMSTSTAAFVTGTAEFEEVSQDEVEESSPGGSVRIRIAAERTDGGEVLVAVGSAEAVQALVVRGSHEIVNGLEFEPFDFDGVAVGGTRPLAIPEAGLFAVSSSGPGRQEITWTVASGEWRAVIMNADGRPGVDVDVRFGVRFPYLRGFAIAGMVIGVVLILAGVLWLAFLYRPGRRREPDAGVAMPPE
ncbi:MAG: hypothetical protein IPN07_01485 [Dehalococcoidia bacterium]|nr:hypothetical protein [Dehalococcoidia bacterium]